MRRRSLTILLSLALLGCSPELEWREFAWPEAGFSVLLPGKPNKIAREVRLADRTLLLVMFPVQKEGLAVGVGYADLPPDIDRARLLADARDALVKNLGGAPADDRPLEQAGALGRAFSASGTADGKSMVLAARVFATEKRFYQVVLVGTKKRVDAIEPALFLDSLKLAR